MMYLSAKVQRFMHPYNTDIGVFCSHIFGIINKKRGELHSLKSPPLELFQAFNGHLLQYS